MCGIAGIYLYSSNKPLKEQTLAAMLSSIRHRGPDERGAFIDERVALGIHRLSIIDLGGSTQPISNEDGSVTVVFNGEIYNYRELRTMLAARGHSLRTSGDTEVIVHLYEEMGESCVEKLRGMFGFAVWDVKRQTLFIARDRLGIKPLYYYDANGCLLFGSEIKAILADPDVPACLDKEALGQFLSLKYVPAPSTMFAGIRALPPGHTLTCDRNGLRVRRYWQLRFANTQDAVDEEAYAEQLEALLRESVRLHLGCDVPFGAFLSGGVDSSTIVALMSLELNAPVKTFSVGFDGADGERYSELPYARMVARRFGTDHHELVLRPHDVERLSQKVIWHLDQPIADEACLANQLVAQLASRHVKMVLTGEGGDELFAGYARYAGERWSPLFGLLPRRAKSLALRLSGSLAGLSRPKIALFALCQSREAMRFASWFPLFNGTAKQRLLTDGLMGELSDPFSDKLFGRHLADSGAHHWLNRMLYIDTNLWLADDLLARGDKTSMAASVEARVPLLDHKLVEFAASLPPQMKLNRFTRKYLLKKVARRWLPPEIVDRKKEGFPMPFAVWFRKELRPFVRDLLSDSIVKKRGLFDPGFVQALQREHEAGTANHSGLIWGLVSVELWHRTFLDPARGAGTRSEPNGTEIGSCASRKVN